MIAAGRRWCGWPVLGLAAWGVLAPAAPGQVLVECTPSGGIVQIRVQGWSPNTCGPHSPQLTVVGDQIHLQLDTSDIPGMICGDTVTYWSMQFSTEPLADGVYHVYTTMLPAEPTEVSTVAVDCTTPRCQPAPLGNGVAGPNGPVHAVFAWDPDGPGPSDEMLVVGGSFSSVGGVAAANIAAWDGTQWHGLGAGVAGEDAVVSALAIHEGDLVAAGRFSLAGGDGAQNIARWDGEQWHALDSGVGDAEPWGPAVVALASVDGNLVASGWFTSAGGAAALHIARFDGTTWHAMGNGLDLPASALVVHAGQLVAGGNGVSVWDGAAWHLLGTGLLGFGLGVTSLIEHEGTLLAGTHQFGFGGPSSGNVARWTGTEWRALDGWWSGPVTVLAVFEGTLIAATDFTTFQRYADLVRLSESGWSHLATADEPVRALAVYRGALVGGGAFGAVGGVVAPGVFRWECPARACGADWDASGAVNSGDISAFLATWLLSVGGGTLTADFNADSSVTSTDVSAFLTAWVAAVSGGC